MARRPISEDGALSADKVDLILADFGLFLGKKSERLIVRYGRRHPARRPAVQTQPALVAYTDERGTHLAKCFARGKIRNQANLLRYQGKSRTGRHAELYRKLDDGARQILDFDRAVDDARGHCLLGVRPRHAAGRHSLSTPG